MEVFEEIRRGYGAGETVKGRAKNDGDAIGGWCARQSQMRSRQARAEAAENQPIEGHNRAAAGPWAPASARHRLNRVPRGPLQRFVAL